VVRRTKTSTSTRKRTPKVSKPPFIKRHYKTISIFACFMLVGISFVLTRMKSIELDYEWNEVSKNYEKVNLENKTLKAKKADLLSIKNLNKIARKYNLKQPENKQIILIP